MRGQSVGDEAVYGEGAEESAEDDTVEADDALTCWPDVGAARRAMIRDGADRVPSQGVWGFPGKEPPEAPGR